MKRRLLRWWWLVLIIPAVIGLARLRFDVEVLNLLPDELPVVHGLKLYQKHFTSGDELVITLRAPDAETAESAARQLAEFLRQETNLVASAVWQAPWQENPDQMAELTAYLWLNQHPTRSRNSRIASLPTNSPQFCVRPASNLSRRFRQWTSPGWATIRLA